MKKRFAFDVRDATSLLVSVASLMAGGVGAQTTATTNQPMPTPIFFNVYWDSSWDIDNADLQRGTVDAATQEVIRSSYLTPLSEYGFRSATFGGSLLPNAKCVQKAPNSPGFFVPGGPGISQFIQCEHDNEPVLQNPIALYNIILPESSLESDAWLFGFCGSGSNASAWHYHGLPDFSFDPWYIPFSDGPVYTIVMTNPQCFSSAERGAFFASLFHEMIEATTDPFPINISIFPPHASAPLSGEIADICEAGQPVSNAGPILAFADTGNNTPNGHPVSLPSYWSNQQQTCHAFSDHTIPAITNPSTVISNFGAGLQLNIQGAGFSPVAPFAPLVMIDDNLDGWEAGNAIDQNAIGIGNLVGVSPTEITAQGLTNSSSFKISPFNNPLTVWVCNPSSLKCVSDLVTTGPPPCPGVQTRNGQGVCACPASFLEQIGSSCVCPMSNAEGVPYVYQQSSGQCVPPPTQICSNGFSPTGPAGLCACTSPSYINTSGVCVIGGCPAGEQYNATLKKCVKITPE